MKKTFLRKLVLGFSTALLFVYSIIYACSDNGDWGIFFDTNFTPEAFVDKSYSPLFLSSDFFYSTDYYTYDNGHVSRFNDEIIQDWSTFLDGKIKTEDVKFFLIDSSATTVDNLYSYYSSKKRNSFSEKWSKKINLKDSKTKDFIEFLYLAQKIKTASTNNSWDYEAESKKQNDPKWVTTIANKYAKSKDKFLKNRYWFQVIKSCFYNDMNDSVVSFFQKTEKSVPKNTLYYRAFSYLAGIEYKNKNYAKSNYLYSQVFDKCPNMRVVAAYCFHPQENIDWNQSLAMAKTTTEKAALWAVQGYYADEHVAIEKIYALDPESEHLDYLLSRLINLRESKASIYETDKKVIEKYNKTNDSLAKIDSELVSRIAKAEKTKKSYLWYTAAGYLETINGNYAQADKNFDKAASKLPKTILASNQLRLLRFINNLNKIKNITTENQKTIVTDLDWLYNEVPKQKTENFRYNNATSWSKTYLSDLFKNQKNVVMAEFFVRNSDYYDNEKNLQAMKTFMAKDNKTALEKIAQSVYNVTLADINNYQAVTATYQNKIPEAIDFMKQTDSIQNFQFYGNPFNGNIKDCHDCDHAAYQKRKYSNIEFLNTIKEMQDKVAKKEDIYINNMLIGNAFYNITHFGNGRTFQEINIIGSGSSPYDYKDKTREMITDCTVAKMYYEQALAVAITDEQKAKCHYMLAKCERNDYYNNKFKTVKNYWEMDDDGINFLDWNGFKKLKTSYSKTKFYQEVIAECGYFNTYVNGPRN
jgi:hypothetical protein